jgi:acetyl-CoA acyltransferase 2
VSFGLLPVGEANCGKSPRRTWQRSTVFRAKTVMVCCILPLFSVLLTLSSEYAFQAQQRYQAALQAGAFEAELVPVALPPRKGVAQSLTADEHPRANTTLQTLSSLSSVFIPKEGTVTAGNASGICDGAAANVVMSEKSLERYGVKPLARIASYAWSACEPEIMGIGPVASIQSALAKIGKKIDDMDIIEINEVCDC